MPGLLTLFTSDSTKREIAEAQRELHLRKKLVHARHRILSTHIKQAMASKKALTTTVAAGFVVGHLGGPRHSKSGDAPKSGLDMGDIVRNGLRIYSLVQTATSLTGFLHFFDE